MEYLKAMITGICHADDQIILCSILMYSQVSGSTLSCSIEFNITSVDLSDSNV